MQVTILHHFVCIDYQKKPYDKQEGKNDKRPRQLKAWTERDKITNRTRPAWAGFKTAEEGRTKIM